MCVYPSETILCCQENWLISIFSVISFWKAHLYGCMIYNYVPGDRRSTPIIYGRFKSPLERFFSVRNSLFFFCNTFISGNPLMRIELTVASLRDGIYNKCSSCCSINIMKNLQGVIPAEKEVLMNVRDFSMMFHLPQYKKINNQLGNISIVEN